MATNELAKLGFRYLFWYLLTNVVLFALVVVWPSAGNSATGFFPCFCAATGTLHGFVKARDRLPVPREYWSLVAAGTALATTIEIAKTIYIVSVRQPPIQLEAGLSIFAFVFIATIIFVSNMFGFSKLFSGQYLVRMRRKREKSALKRT